MSPPSPPPKVTELLDEEELIEFYELATRGHLSTILALEHAEAHQVLAYITVRNAQLWLKIEQRLAQ